MLYTKQSRFILSPHEFWIASVYLATAHSGAPPKAVAKTAISVCPIQFKNLTSFNFRAAGNRTRSIRTFTHTPFNFRAAGNRTRSIRTRIVCTTGILQPDVWKGVWARRMYYRYTTARRCLRTLKIPSFSTSYKLPAACSLPNPTPPGHQRWPAFARQPFCRRR